MREHLDRVAAAWRHEATAGDAIIARHLISEMAAFRVGITYDFAPGRPMRDQIDETIAELLEPLPELEWEFLSDFGDEIGEAVGREYDAVIAGEPRWTNRSFAAASRLAGIVYWGIGVDKIDLASASASAVIVANSPSLENQLSVAESVLAFILALSKQLSAKDRLTRAGQVPQAQRLLGRLLRGRTIGTVGFGATARLLVDLVRPFGLERVLAHDPYVDPTAAAARGVELSDLESLMARADYVVIMCSLTGDTCGLVDERLLELMQPHACLINAARGGIVDQTALTRALVEGRIAGAALDVFEPEPPSADDPLLALDNVIATGHAIAWTVESLRGSCVEACRGITSLYHGEPPAHTVNRDVFSHPKLQAKLERRRRSRSSPV